MAMDTNERAEHKRELARIRARHFYERHKEQVKAKVKAEYVSHKANILDAIRIRLQPEREQAISGSCYVTLNERRKKYRQCGLCRHYAYLQHTEMISPSGDIVLMTYCPYCYMDSESIIYKLS